MSSQARKHRKSATHNGRSTKSTSLVSIAKKSPSFPLWNRKMAKYMKELDAIYPDYDPDDPNISAAIAAPVRVITEFEESAPKVNFSLREDDARFHVPRNLVTTALHLAAMPAVVTARRLTGKSRHSGWSFRDEAITTWLHFTLGTKDYKQWRRVLQINTMLALARHSKNAKKIDEPGINGYWIDDLKGPIPPEEKDLVWLYFHGGGYVSGDPAMHLVAHLKILSELRKKYDILNVRILSVRYPLTPEKHYPTQINVAFYAYRWLIYVHKTPPHKVIVGGDSAGGNLTLALLQRIRDEGLPMPALAILISPWVEMLLTIPNNSLGEKQIRNDILSPRISRSTVLAYLGKSGADPADPMISPINMDFTGIPPMIVQWGGQELFSSQIRELCARAEQAGIRVMRDADPDMFHIYQMLGDFVGPRATRGLERLCAMMAVMITHEMGSNGRCGGPGPRKRTPPRPNKARSLYGVKAAQSAFSIMTTKSAAGRLERPVNEES